MHVGVRMMNYTFVVVGPGRVGRALAEHLSEVGHRLVGVVAKDAQQSTRVGREWQALSPTPLVTDWTSAAPLADIVLITTPDRVLHGAAAGLASGFDPCAPRHSRATKVALHASGALPSSVLAPLQTHGFAVGSLHPLQAVSGGGAATLRRIAWGIEGDPEAVAVARTLVNDLHGAALVISSAVKPLYHAAACVASNYVMVLMQLAVELLVSAGVAADQAGAALIPLLHGAVENARQQGVPQALTGPIERGDLATLQEHLTGFVQQGVRAHIGRLYSLLGIEAASMAVQKGSISPEQAKALQEYLASGVPINDQTQRE